MLRYLFSALFAVLSGFAVHAQKPDYKNLLDRLDSIYEQTVEEWGVPGMAVAIVKDGEIIFSKGYGVKELGKPDRPDGNTLFAIASNSKAFTAAIIGQLVDEGKCNWDDRVQKYIPWFSLSDPQVASLVTLRDLLSHRVGLGTFSGDVIWYKSELAAHEILNGAAHLPLVFDFRSGYGYSNLMYIAAGEVIKAITGMSWYDNARERFLQPLGMQRTTIFARELGQLGNYATPHALDGVDNVPIVYTDWAEIAAMGGLISSVNEVANWMIFNLNHGVWNNERLLSQRSFNLIHTPHNNYIVDHTNRNDFNNHFNGYGLGWGLRDYHGRLFVGHTGGYDGMISAVSMLADEQLGVVVLTNGMKSPYMAVTYQTLDAFIGVNPDKNWSDDLLTRSNRRTQSDTRIAQRKASRMAGTQTSLPLAAYVGTYESAIYGKMEVVLDGDRLMLKMEHSPELAMYLNHFHYDVFEIEWVYDQAWFAFGTVKFNTDNYLKVVGIDFDVPNDDIFFEELKPRKVE